MNDNFLLVSILEAAMALFIIWGLFNEPKLVEFEDRLLAVIKKMVRRRKRSSVRGNHRRDARHIAG